MSAKTYAVEHPNIIKAFEMLEEAGQAGLLSSELQANLGGKKSVWQRVRNTLSGSGVMLLSGSGETARWRIAKPGVVLESLPVRRSGATVKIPPKPYSVFAFASWRAA
jgi:hypothetical protein